VLAKEQSSYSTFSSIADIEKQLSLILPDLTNIPERRVPEIAALNNSYPENSGDLTKEYNILLYRIIGLIVIIFILVIRASSR
jgi:hypothetical protein